MVYYKKEVNNGKYLKNTSKAFTFSSVYFGGSISFKYGIMIIATILYEIADIFEA
ncbi:MAG: hypothetical protein PHG90_06075 [Clostridia bacterium]|nr:hypothetical protein [Clostridia bacterium]